MEKYSQIIIIGGGASVNEGINQGLWCKIKDKFTIGLNYAYKFFDSSVLMFVDSKAFFEKNYQEIKNLALLVGKNDNVSENLAQETYNTVLMKPSNSYNRSLKNGVYSPELVGLFSLTIATYLLDKGDIFLLGFDMDNSYNLEGSIELIINGEKRYYIPLNSEITLQTAYSKEIRIINGKPYIAVTHWYQDKVNHKGTGKTNYFYIDSNLSKFKVYNEIKDLNIYNVSPNSRLPYFPKISYKKFFKKINNKKYNQKNIRSFVVDKLIKAGGKLYGKKSEKTNSQI